MCDLVLLGIQADPETRDLINRLCNCGCHVASIKLVVKNLEALEAACVRLGLTFMEGQTSYKWYGVFLGGRQLPEGVDPTNIGKCHHAIKVPGAAYEIGLLAREDGTYSLLWDFYYQGGLEQALGKDCNLLKQAYGIEAAKLAALREGHSIWEETLQDGSVKLHVQVGA